MAAISATGVTAAAAIDLDRGAGHRGFQMLIGNHFGHGIEGLAPGIGITCGAAIGTAGRATVGASGAAVGGGCSILGAAAVSITGLVGAGCAARGSGGAAARFAECAKGRDAIGLIGTQAYLMAGVVFRMGRRITVVSPAIGTAAVATVGIAPVSGSGGVNGIGLPFAKIEFVYRVGIDA